MKVKGKLMAALGSLKDQAAIGRAAISDRSVLSAIEIAVLRSTDPFDAPLDNKYVDEILFVISNAPGSITFLARRLSTRLESTRDPLVALKTLVLIHRLLRGGDRYFEQDLRNLWSSGDLRIDRRWFSGDSEPLCSFTVSYSQFLGERMEWLINQAGKLEPIIAISVMEYKSFEEKEAESVLHRLSKCQTFLDLIMDCLPPNSLRSRHDHVVSMSMNIVLKESFRVYESFCEGVEMVVSSFFDLKNKSRVLALGVLKRACILTSKLREFYEECKSCSIVSKSLDYPLVRIIEFSLLDSLTVESKGEESMDNGASNDLFSQKLETKISMLWVEFGDGDSQSSNGVCDHEGESTLIGKAREYL